MIGRTTNKLHLITRIVAVGLTILISACATIEKNQAGEAVSENHLRSDMVSDLLSVLPQLLDPSKTSIQFSDTESGDISAVVTTLANHGYGLQRVDADQGNAFLSLTETPTAINSNTNEMRLQLTVGNLELTRTYRVVKEESMLTPIDELVWRNGSGVVPYGPLIIAGTKLPVELKGMNVQLSSAASTDLTRGSIEYGDMASIEGGIPTISLITPELVQSITTTAAVPVITNLNSSNDSFNNLYNGGVSDYRPFLEDYNRIVREFVIFPNDSQNLGRSGKSLVKAFVERYSKNTDVIGIIGCSNGPTALEIGNEGLALGRANRIVEELTMSGIASDKIFDEGCWSSSVEAQGFPNRGVVVDLYRRAG